MGTSHNGPKTSVKDPTKFLDFLGGLLRQRIRCKDQTARIWLLRTFRSANGFYNARNAFKVGQSAWSSGDCAIFRRG